MTEGVGLEVMRRDGKGNKWLVTFVPGPLA